MGRVRGLVVGKPSLCRLARTEVHNLSTNQMVVADKNGEFVISGLRPGPDTIVARFIGYGRISVPITVPTSGGLSLLIPMDLEAVAYSHGGPCPAA